MSKRRKLLIFIFSFLIIILIAIGVLCSFRITNADIEIEGNEKYTKEEMINYIFTSKWDRNPFVLSLKNKYGKQKTIPFIDEYTVEMKSVDSVKITVYEKKVIGYVEYMGSNIYFDKDGTVVESSSKVLEDVPKVTGLKLDYIVLYEDLPVKDRDVFDMILDVAQALKKYEISTDKIYISKDNQCMLYLGDVEVNLGSNDNLDDKIRTLRDMLGNITGLKGTLDLSQYSENSTGYTFKKSE